MKIINETDLKKIDTAITLLSNVSEKLHRDTDIPEPNSNEETFTHGGGNEYYLTEDKKIIIFPKWFRRSSITEKDESAEETAKETIPLKPTEEILSVPEPEEAEKEESQKKTKERGILVFTFEEVKRKMPKRLHFYTNGLIVYYRKRQTGKESYSYNVRFKRCGYNIDFSEKKKGNLKARFIEEIKKQDEERERRSSGGVPYDFDGFTMYVFENFRKPKLTANTYKLDFQKYRSHIKPFLGKINVKDINPGHCKRVIDHLLEQKHERLAQSVYSLMNVIFKSAISHHLIQYNPMDIILTVSHECEHGEALTKEEEKFLLDSVAGTPYEIMFAIALYTGMRPNEYATAWKDDDFIHCVNSKRKTKKVEYKKIPISPMLRPYLEGVNEIHFYRVEHIRDKMKEILPKHKLYDLRTTFYTRCQECGVAEVARKEFVGHSLGALANTYTDLSDEFLLKEGEKLRY